MSRLLVSRQLDAMNETLLSYFKIYRVFSLILEICIFLFDSSAQTCVYLRQDPYISAFQTAVREGRKIILSDKRRDFNLTKLHFLVPFSERTSGLGRPVRL